MEFKMRSGRQWDRSIMERMENALDLQKSCRDVIRLQVMVHMHTRLQQQLDKPTLAQLSRVGKLDCLMGILDSMVDMEDRVVDWYKSLSTTFSSDINNQLLKYVAYIEKSSRSMSKTWMVSRQKSLQLDDILIPLEVVSLQGAAPVGRAPVQRKSMKQILHQPQERMEKIAETQADIDRKAKQLKDVFRSVKSYDPFERKIAHLDKDMHRCLTALEQLVTLLHQSEAMVTTSMKLHLSKVDVQLLLLKFPQPYVLEEDLSD